MSIIRTLGLVDVRLNSKVIHSTFSTITSFEISCGISFGNFLMKLLCDCIWNFIRNTTASYEMILRNFGLVDDLLDMRCFDKLVLIMHPDSKVHGAHLGRPRWAPCWSHEPCYQGIWPGYGNNAIAFSDPQVFRQYPTKQNLIKHLCVTTWLW